MERKSASIFSNCPWEDGNNKVLQPFGKRSEGPYNQANTIKKQDGTSVVTAFEETRDGLPKAYIPNFFYRAPFGYPRYKDLNYFRQLARSIYVDMCTTAIIDEVCSVEWEIVAEDRAGNEVPGKEKDIERIQDFFENPNTNKESWETIIRMMLPDLLEINSGVLVKVFNTFGEMVEICARDGMAFTKNPDPYGFYSSRADLILMKNILGEGEEQTQQMDYPAIQAEMTAADAENEGAYFQYGFNTGARPIPFGRREVVWFEKKVRTDNLYGISSMEILSKTVQTLIYAVESQLEYFNDNSIPPGVLGLEGMTGGDLKAFGQQWVQQQKVQDSLGNWKHTNHKLPMVNKMPKFERLGFTNQELELIESQKWWSKLVWGAFGITATELGFTEDASGAANQIVQTSIAKKRIIYPLLRLIEYHVNTEIIPEFGVKGVRYKYKIFDIDEETKKWGLYKMQTEADLKTINECRNAEGLDELEGGDETGAMRNDRQQREDREYFNGEPMQQEYDDINEESSDKLDKMANRKAYLKYKYAKRTGSPGNYIYWYKNPLNHRLERGADPTKKPLKMYPKLGTRHPERPIPKEEVTYTTWLNLAEDTWEFTPKKEKEQLIEEFGYEKKWADIRTIRELVQRGGADIAGKLREISTRMLELSEGEITINWNDRTKEPETKAMTTDSPNTLESNEEMGPSEKKLNKQIVDLLKENKEKIFELLDAQGKDEPLTQIKSIDDLPKLIQKIFSFFTIKSVVNEVIDFKFNFGWDNSEKKINMNIPINKKAIEFLQDYTFNNIKDMTEEVANDLKSELSRGIINGESIPKLKARVTKVFNVGETRAGMIARTEVNNCENQGKLLAMKESGMKMKKQWVSTHDNRTSSICKRLDGQIVGLNDTFKDRVSGWEGQAPSAHVNCRSTIIFLIDEEDE